MARPLSLFWRVFAVNAGLPGLTAVLLLFTPVTTSMRERALLVDGALAIERAPGGGVEVLLEVPVTPVADPPGVQP